MRYVVKEPYTYTTQINGKLVKYTGTRDINRYLTLASSLIQVKLDQSTDVQGRSAVYRVDYTADYKIVNTLQNIDNFFFSAPPPNGYSLLSSYKVERSGASIPKIPDDYNFRFNLQPGQETTLRVSYKAQGGPRWVYSASGQLLSNFRLTAIANFPNADFASGIIPNEIKSDRQSTQFTWVT